MEITRRGLLLAAALSASVVKATGTERPRILLRNSWTSINIGDIAHPFGMIRLFQKYLPGAEVRLMPSNTENGVKELLKSTFPSIDLVTTQQKFDKAKRDCNILINGSGADIVQKQIIEWRADTGKPFGVYGVSLNANQPHVLDRVNESVFTYFRDSVSLQMALDLGADPKKVALGLDSTFGITDLTNDALATAFLKNNGLEDGRFLCCIPRLRWSPHWEMRDSAFEADKAAVNERMKENDHIHLREAIIEVVRQTALSVLVCCEDVSQIAVGKELIIDKLPDDVRKRVYWRDSFWLPDEAISVFKRSAGLFGNEMHSPIMCIINNIPAIVCRFREQGPKGYMWDDIGLGEWLFDLDRPEDGEKIVPAVLKMAKEPTWATALAMQGRKNAYQIQDQTMRAARDLIGSP